jgi:hypothetical protein
MVTVLHLTRPESSAVTLQQPGVSYLFLGALANLRKAIIGFVMSVHPSICVCVCVCVCVFFGGGGGLAWNKSAATGRVFIKFYI